MPRYTFNIKTALKPEAKVQKSVKKYLELRGWFVMITVGNLYQKGIPDLYCTHKRFGIRWVELKLPDMKGSRFTKDQILKFPQLWNNGTGIYIITAGTDDEYKKLFETPNLRKYMEFKSDVEYELNNNGAFIIWKE